MILYQEVSYWKAIAIGIINEGGFTLFFRRFPQYQLRNNRFDNLACNGWHESQLSVAPIHPVWQQGLRESQRTPEECPSYCRGSLLRPVRRECGIDQI